MDSATSWAVRPSHRSVISFWNLASIFFHRSQLMSSLGSENLLIAAQHVGHHVENGHDFLEALKAKLVFAWQQNRLDEDLEAYWTCAVVEGQVKLFSRSRFLEFLAAALWIFLVWIVVVVVVVCLIWIISRHSMLYEWVYVVCENLCIVFVKYLIFHFA